MQGRHVKVLLKYVSCLMFLKFQKHKSFHKINIGFNGTKNYQTFLRACEPLTNFKIENPL